ncbi:MAG: Holliday junction resolvase RuvX [Acidimicrobiales bacterium]
MSETPPEPGRVVGIDLGRRRVGVAVSDDRGRVATPHAVLARSGDDAADRKALVAVVRALGAGRVVVGLPLSLDGSTGPAARGASEEAAALAALVDVPVDLHDERLTTVAVLRSPRPERRRRATRRAPVDSQAAAVMLQSWLDRRQAGTVPPASAPEPPAGEAPAKGGTDR